MFPDASLFNLRAQLMCSPCSDATVAMETMQVVLYLYHTSPTISRQMNNNHLCQKIMDNHKPACFNKVVAEYHWGPFLRHGV